MPLEDSSPVPQEAQVKLQLDVLLKDYDRLSTDIRAFEGSIERYLGIGGTFVAAAVTFAATTGPVIVWYMLPLAMFCMTMMTLDKLRNIMWLGGYKRAVELRINSLSGVSVVCWEAFIQSQRKKPDIFFVNNLTFLLGIQAVLTGYSVYVASSRGLAVTVATIIVAIGAALLIALSLRKVLNSHAHAFAAAKNLLSKSRVSNCEEP